MKILYHGSDKIVSSPRYGVGKADNDFGSGFYMTEDIESAKEWAAVNGQDGSYVCNQYEIDMDGLNVIRFEDYGILAWMSEIIANRGTDGADTAEVGEKLISKYKIDTSKADVIIGYTADGSYYKMVDAFLAGMFAIEEIDSMFRKWKVGTQVVIKSPKAFERIRFIGSDNIYVRKPKAQTESPAYDERYLDDVMKVHEYLFELMEQCEQYDTLSMIDSYMRYSSIRKRMDEGNWSALNKSGKQLYNDIPLQYCKEKESDEKYDGILLGWVADIYVLFQWKYNLPSVYISAMVPAKEIIRAFNPLHETSYKNACEKFYHKYFEKH